MLGNFYYRNMYISILQMAICLLICIAICSYAFMYLKYKISNTNYTDQQDFFQTLKIVDCKGFRSANRLGCMYMYKHVLPSGK